MFFAEFIRRKKDIGKLELSSTESVGWFIWLKDLKWYTKKQLYQRKSTQTNEVNDTPVDVEPMEILFDTFYMPIPQKAPEEK